MNRPGLCGFTPKGWEKIIERQGGKQEVKDDRLCIQVMTAVPLGQDKGLAWQY